MHIVFKGHTISNLSEWEKLIFSGKKALHWKKGRSAYSLADYIINQNGAKHIATIISPFINEEFNLVRAHPEFEARFDTYGHGREHDLGIFGTTASGKKIFIGIEAKVDESFGDTIASAKRKANAKLARGENTNALKRIEELLAFNFDEVNQEDLQLRYQLLFSTAGTLCIEADIHIMLILVFKTETYDIPKGQKNYMDLIKFINKSNATNLTPDANRIDISGKALTIIYKEIPYGR
ncbi:hypothetical protein [Carboxylicivirga sp. M1479]|uniref:DUF6946 family protein n=1 Tax=Carboxylicivirga sp. M1479 TaxID=2594476 RepID=UPI00117760B6|nr:hypothetical protein [Carboxylicivirga sp. M1479]TRX72562.1 hypothetical protein FNN09_01080 [Carboxylicivirga sp. M1479]